MAPKVFLSSTIRDLADLRSAIKFWLEEQGFEVLASEWPDFAHALDREAVQAALVPIADADYFVLLIGVRAGKLLKESKVSVTRMEFRHARELRKQTGKPQMLHFVRADVATARHLGVRSPESSEEDWPAIIELLEEIESGGTSGDPNWIQKFSSFRDVADALRATLRITGPMRRRALAANLAEEVAQNSTELLHPTNGTVVPKSDLLPLEDVPPPPGVTDDVVLGYPGTFRLFRFRLCLPRTGTLSKAALDAAIDSGEFLDYDGENHCFVISPLQHALLDLREQLARLQSSTDLINTNSTVRDDTASAAAVIETQGATKVSGYTVMFMHGARAAMENVLNLNRAIYRHLEGLDATVKPSALLPPNPHPIEADRLADQNPKRDKVIEWLRSEGLP